MKFNHNLNKLKNTIVQHSDYCIDLLEHGYIRSGGFSLIYENSRVWV